MAVTEDVNVANVDWNRGIRMQLQPRQRVIANKKAALITVRIMIWSGWRDLNPRPLDPQSSALPNCATARRLAASSRLQRVEP